MSYDVQIIEIGPPIFLPNTQNAMLYNAFQSARHPKIAPSRGTSTFPCNTFVWTHPTHTQKPAFRILRTDNNRGANTPAKKLITAINTIKINELSSS